MRLVILAAALALPAGSALARAPEAAPALNPSKFAGARLDCMAARIQHARPDVAAKFNRLGDLPPGDLILGVVRQIEGCQEPVVVRQGYGAAARPEARR